MPGENLPATAVKPVISANFLMTSWALVFLGVAESRFVLRRVVYALRRRGHFLSPAVIVGANEEGRALAQQLQDWEDRGQRAFVRTAPPAFPPPTVPQGAGLPAQLLTALQKTLAPQPSAPVSDVVSAISVSITDQMSTIRGRLQGGKPCDFRSLLSPVSSRVEVIVTFLALLEMIRRREVVVWQERVFGEILISTRCERVEASQGECMSVASTGAADS